MGCLEGKKEGRREPRQGDYQCERCGAVSPKKNRICEPKKVKKPKKPKKPKKAKSKAR